MILPKGTLLFRGMNSVQKLTSDYAGIANGNSFCLNKNFNVFFYPYPFIADVVGNYGNLGAYFTRKDIKILKLVSPSKFSRADRNVNKGGIISCDKIPDFCNIKGRDYDPCIDYSKVPEDVSGMVAIAKIDADELFNNKSDYQDYYNKYFATFKDSRGVTGVPEIILHPRIDKTERNETITDFKEWYNINKADLNFSHLHILPNMRGMVEGFIDKILSSEGVDLGDGFYHAKMNKRTGFFQIVELSDKFEEGNFSTKNPDAELKIKRSFKTPPVESFPEEETILPEIVNVSRSHFTEITPYFNEDETYHILNRYLNVLRTMNNFTYNGKNYKLSVKNLNAQEYITRNKQRYHVKIPELANRVSAFEESGAPALHMNGMINTLYKKYKSKSGSSRRSTRRSSSSLLT